MNNKPLVLLTATTFLAMSASALADDMDMRPLSEMTGQQVLAARQAAEQRWYRMTPEERIAARDASQDKKDGDRTAMDEYATTRKGPHLTLKVFPRDFLTPEEKKAKRAEKAWAQKNAPNDPSSKRPER
jgi:hypothetical protein